MTLSLKTRQILIFVLIIIMVLPLVFLSIGQAFRHAQISALQQQLEAQLYSIIGEIDLDAEIPQVESSFLPPALNQLDSGTIAVIIDNNKESWRSDSGLNQNPTINNENIENGQFAFKFDNDYWRYSYALFYDNEYGTHNLVIHVMQHQHIINNTVSAFNQIIIAWFLGIAIVLILALAFGLWSTLTPLKKLDQQIKLVEKGDANQIDGIFPKELTRVKEDLNLLISAQERQKERYRAYLSDLTHALKTPIAVMRSNDACQTEQISEQLDRMTNIIEHQLRKAASGGDVVWKKKVNFNQVVTKLIGVMDKIYASKQIQFQIELNDEYDFYGDEDDLMEILGNLLDNACKACQNKIKISVGNAQPLQFTIEDDGPGIAVEQREQLLVRGQRLDTYSQGHGVGMAIVNDLINSYQANMQIDDSALGGAKFIVHFKDNEQTLENRQDDQK